MPAGVFRRVLLIGGYAVKLPRIRHFTAGMRCNRWEKEMWQCWRPKLGWQNLCPVLFADPLGVVVVMPRAEQPVGLQEVEAAIGDYFPDNTAESKPEDYGRIGQAVLALDYGPPWQDMIVERRSYYAKHVRAREGAR